MAQNPALTQLLTALNAPPHPTMGTDFFAHVGSQEDIVCRPNSQLKSDEVVRPGRRIGRVGADDDGNLCVVRRSVLEHYK